jgi:hypothetical protein
LSENTNQIIQKIDLSKLKIAQRAAFDSYGMEHDECLPGTRVELLRKIEEWTISPHGKCIFWLKGKAGTGKSTISRTVARSLKAKNSLGASFFFKRGEEDRGTAKWLFPTLAQQLLTRMPQLGPSIQKAIEDDPYISEKALGEQFDKLLLCPLQNVDLSQNSTVLIVIDALDECGSEENNVDIRAILRLLPRLQASKCVRLRFFLTSRPELPIQLGFKDIEGDHQNLDLHDVPESGIADDISIFLRYSLSRIRQSHGLSMDWPGDNIIEILISRTVPLFISAATLCRFIDDLDFHPQVRLKEILADQSKYVSELASTYLPVLKQILAKRKRGETRQLIAEFKKIVGAIILLATPLSVNALARLLGLAPDNVQRRLGRLHSVLHISNDLDTEVRLLHLSFRDYLLDTETKDEKDSEQFWIDERAVHYTLTYQCLQVMRDRLRRNICKLPNNDTPRSEIDIHSVNHFLPPEVRYACRYWTQHLVQSQNQVPWADALSFLKVHFLHWVEAMSILGFLSEVVTVITRLWSIIQVSYRSSLRAEILRL